MDTKRVMVGEGMKREQGSVVVVGIIMMMLLSAMGATLLALSKTDLQIAMNHRDGIAAQYVAEAGIQYAVTKLKTDPDFVSQTELATTTAVQSIGSMPVMGNYTVKTGPDSITTNKNNRLVTAVGVVNQAKRQVTANVTLPRPIGEGNSFIVIWKN